MNIYIFLLKIDNLNYINWKFKINIIYKLLS